MILTVTPNTGLDRVLFLPELCRNRRNQAAEVVESMGGKGCDVSLILRELGEETAATGLAGGDTGRRMEAMLRRAGVVPDFVWVPGETRVNTVLIETETGDHTTICAPGLAPGEDALSGLLLWIERWAVSVDAVVLAGSLPESWPAEAYTQLVEAARKGGRPVVVDVAGAALQAALVPGVAAIKPNRDELEGICGPLPDLERVVTAGRRLRDAGARRVLASLGPEGAVLVSERGAWQAETPAVPVVNPAGAGDGMTACLALAAVREWDEAETLRWAIAVSTAIVMTRGTAEIRRADVDELLPRVRVERVE
jgi:1-phosphofructokinase family hexose kinase